MKIGASKAALPLAPSLATGLTGVPPLWKGPGTRDRRKNLGLGYPPKRTWDQSPGKAPGSAVDAVDAPYTALNMYASPS